MNEKTPADPTVQPAAPAVPVSGSGSAKALRGALLRYQVMAFVTGVVLATMTVIGLPYRYLIMPAGEEPPAWYSIGWVAHGWFYIAYVAVTLDLVFRLRWHVGKALLIALAGTIPFMSFVAERYVRLRVEPIIDERARAARD